ncbi:MAG: hypothetical protein R2845_04945 [Thermomicrobiales bacterium]
MGYLPPGPDAALVACGWPEGHKTLPDKTQPLIPEAQRLTPDS